jgi:hypothetical protein
MEELTACEHTNRLQEKLVGKLVGWKLFLQKN